MRARRDTHETVDTRRAVLDAALRCIRQVGLTRTTLGQVAAEAHVSRQTVYNHFKSADALIRAALFDASYAFTGRLVAHIRTHERTDDRVVEAVVFCLDELPKEPFLQVVAEPALGGLVRDSLFVDATTRDVLTTVAGVCLEPSPELAPRTDELAEMMTRLVLSFLVLREQAPRSGASMRTFLRRWLLPGLYADVPEDAPKTKRVGPKR